MIRSTCILVALSGICWVSSRSGALPAGQGSNPLSDSSARYDGSSEIVLDEAYQAVLHSLFTISPILVNTESGTSCRAVSLVMYTTQDELWQPQLAHCSRLVDPEGTESIVMESGFDLIWRDPTGASGGATDYRIEVKPGSGATWAAVRGISDLDFAVSRIE